MKSQSRSAVVAMVLVCLLGYSHSQSVINVLENQGSGVIERITLEPHAVFTSVEPSTPDSIAAINEYFSYDQGEIVALNTIDRDDIAERFGSTYDPASIVITYLLSNGMEHTVTINLIDTNDNPPVFLNKVGHVLISEGLLQSKPIDRAIDHDEGIHAVQNYSLVDDLDGLFRLSIRRDDQTGAIIELKLENTVALDREAVSEYTLQLVAFEGTENPRSANQTLEVSVEDVCDKSPSFPTTRYLPPPIPEDSMIGTVILPNITAYDADSPEEERLEYDIREVCRRRTLSSGCEPVTSDQHPFTLDSESGRLVLDGQLDREEFAKYQISVHVVDQCSRTASATVVVEVADVNDNCPSVTFSSSVVGGKIKETITSLPFSFGFFRVSDDDSGDNGNFSVALYEVVNGELTNSDTFQLDGLELYLIRRVDREVQSEYPLWIVATDHGIESCTTNFSITLAVEDFNDNPPVIREDNLQSAYELDEEVAMNFYIATINASDADDPATGNGMITFHLPDSDSTFRFQNLFEIESVTGILKVAGRLDHETRQEFQVLVVASDNPMLVSNRRDPVLNDSIIINVTLRDINDNTPLIHYPSGVFEVREDFMPATRLFTINATDLDSSPEFSTLTYTIIPSDGPGPFNVNTDSGEVFVVENGLDFESTQAYTLTLRVSDGTHVAEEEITISVVNINDEPPEFEMSSRMVRANIREDESLGIHVATINATDPDNMDQNIRFQILSGNDLGHFDIDPVSGVITTTGPLNKEEVANYTLIISANDGELNSEDYAVVTVNVLDINDNPPVFINTPYHFQVEEGRLPGTTVHGATEDDEVEADDLDVGENGRINFEILGAAPSVAIEWFTIDVETGRITTKERLDREHSALESDGIVRLSVEASNPSIDGSNQLSTIAEVSITIVDINDQTPFFEMSVRTVTLSENYEIGAPFLTVQAIDLDQPPYNEITYELIPSPPDIDELISVNSVSGELTLIRSLDHETQSRVEFEVRAYDANERIRNNQQTIIINVTDALDPCLKFVDFETAVDLEENSPPGTHVLTFEATDLLGQSVSTVEYSLTNLDGSPSAEFAISENQLFQATIHTNAVDIDREALVSESNPLAVYQLTITAHDGVSTSECVTITSVLTVTITDLNDNPPIFSFNFYNFSLAENSLAGALVDTVQATDSDDGVNSEISFSIQDDVPFQIASNGDIRATRPLDHDPPSGTAQYTFNVIAQDNGVMPLSSISTVRVNVIDVNDNNPVFDRNQNRTFVVPEDTAIGETIASIRVTDNDSGMFGTVTLRVNQGSTLDQHFQLNPDGTIVLMESLDREMRDSYSFDVEARDAGGRTAVEMITIIVSDINDNPPIFGLEPLQTIELMENHPAGENWTFAQVTATDADIGLNAEINFRLEDRSYDRTFCLNSRTGQLYLCQQSDSCNPPVSYLPVRTIDYERQSHYELTILAYDQALPRHFATKTIQIEILNVNEHAPVFDSDPVLVTVDEGIGIGAEVLRIKAYDWDGDPLTYSVFEGTVTSNNFRYQQGTIVTSTRLDYNTQQKYVITLRARETHTDEARYADTHVTVYVRNINDKQPLFDTTVYPTSTTIPESTEPGTIILTVHANDADNATHDAVSYQIKSGNVEDAFSIDSQTGDVLVQSHLDYDSVQSYTLTVEATDTGYRQMTSTALELGITIENINDELPIFTANTYEFDSTENSPPGTRVGQVQAPDRDLEPFGTVRYSLPNGDNGFFEVDSITGEVRSLVTIDREEAEFSTVTFPVLATDSGNPPMTATAQVVITLQDANDNPPQFSRYQYYLYGTRDLEPNVSIFNLADEVSDIDLNENAIKKFEIASQVSGDLLDVTSTGQVMLTAPPENGVQIYEAIVRVFNSQESPLSDTAYVRLVIEDNNDHHPRFDQLDGYDVTVGEDEPRDSLVFDVSEHVSDSDTGSNSELSYQFQESYSKFFIDSTSGQVTLVTPLDFEGQKLYTLRVAAVDGAGRVVETTLSVTVTSVNDNQPVFDDFPARLDLSPIPGANIDLFTVSATDDDEGSDGIVRYSLMEDGIVSASFAIDPELGVVRSKGQIVAGGTYNLTVTAYDNGSPTQSQDAVILVAIQASSAPTFVGVSNPHVMSVDEDQAGGSLRTFRTTPPEAVFSLVYTDAPSGLFSVSKSQGFLLLQDTLDYRTEQRYNLIIEAYIEDSTNLNHILRYSSYLEIIIDVIDVNNNDPQFVLPTYTTSISEDEDIGVFIFEAQALDDDTGIFGELNYEISEGNIGRVFSINGTSGVVTLGGILDREAYSSYDLTIRAFDRSSQPNFGKMTLHIDVTDVNDYVPRFVPEGNRSVGVYEHPHTSGGVGILRLAAIDLDEGPPLRYELFLVEAKYRGTVVASSPRHFEIDLDTGMISLTDVELDFESIDYYLLRVEATDTVSTVTTYLEVNVLDVNDNTPMFLQSSHTIEVWEQQPIDSYVGRISSGDIDEGINGVVTYSLGEGWDLAGEGVFAIDPHTGVIRVKATLKAMINLFTFNPTVHVTDQGNPARSDSVSVTVSVTDVNNNKPVFDMESYVFNVSITASPGDIVGGFSWNDVDFRENSGAIVQIPQYYNEANMLFLVSRSNPGTITLKANQGLEARDYTFRLEADNPSFNPECAPYRQVSYVDVTVVVYPLCPSFEDSEYNIEVEEGPISSEMMLTRLSASSSVGRQVDYYFRDHDLALPFSIDRESGEVTLSSALDRETIESYEFYVIASDSIYQPQTCSAVVRVTVLDVNDNDPVFVEDEYQLSVKEMSSTQVSVGEVLASDRDQGANSRIHYELSELATVPFTVDSESGEIFTTEIFDAEDIDSYTFEVRAIDGGDVPRTGSVSVTVNIVDVNEFPPTFSQRVYTFQIGPELTAGTVVGRITAADLDTDSQLHYYFINDEPKQYFEIDVNTGEIIFTVSQRESRSIDSQRSIERRQTDSGDEYFTVNAIVAVSDGVNNVTTNAEFSLHNSFRQTPVPSPDSTLIIIIVVVASVVAVIVVFLVVAVIACVCTQRNKRKNVKIKDSVSNGHNFELERFNSRRSQGGSRSSTPGQNRYATTTNIHPYSSAHTTIHHSSGSGSNSSRQSYCNSADDELDSNNGDILKRSAYNSPGITKRSSNVSHAAHARSTSDLASSVGTDALGSQQLPHPKAKIDAIYAAHHGLLNNRGSRESIHSNHTFASEGGGEADAEDDIHAMLTSKYEFEDEDDDVTTLPDDSSYMGKDPHLPDSNANLDIPPVEEDHIPRYPYSQPTESEWAPRSTLMDQTIDEIHEMASYSSSSQDHHIPMSRYREPSQPPMSMYGGTSSQGSRISLPRHSSHHAARGYELPPHMGQPPPSYEYDYYHHPQEPRQARHMSHPRYGSASGLSIPQDYGIPPPRDYLPPREPHIDHRHHQARGPPAHMMFSQDMPPTYSYPPHGNIQALSSDTPTDGTVTPSRAMGQEYDHRDYMSSSSTSLGSTNLSGTTSSIGASASQRIYHK